MRHRSTRSRLSRRATSPVMVPGGRRRSRIPIPAVIALVSALLAGLAVVLAPSAPQAGAQPVAPAPEGFVEGGHPCETVVTYRKYERVYYKDVFLYSDHLGNSPSGTATYRFHVRHFYSTGGDWVVMPPPNQSSHICYDHPVPTPRRSAAGPIVDPPLIVGGALLIPGDGSGSGSGSGESSGPADTSGLFGPDGELLRPDDFPPLDPVEVTARALEANPSALESCMAGAGDYVAAIRAQGVDLVKQMLRTELQLLSPQDATGPAVADVVAFLKNPFDYQSAAADPARWLCGQLVGLAADLGIGKLARGAGRTAPEFGELVPDLIEAAPGSGGRAVATVAGLYSENTGIPFMADPPRGFRADGTLPRDTTLPLLDQGTQPICGVVSCVMVLQGAGKQIDARAILQEAKGFEPSSTLTTILSRNGINSVTDRGPLRTLLAQKAGSRDPFIAVVNVQGSPAGEFPNGGGAHAVVVDGFTTRYGQEVVAVRNPWGKQYFQLLSEFEKQFAGSWIRPL